MRFVKSNGNVIFGVVFLTLLLSLFIFSIIKNNIFFVVFSLLFLSVWLLLLVRIKKIIISNNRIEYRHFWSNKLVWEIEMGGIQKIEITYLSDTSFNAKHLTIYDKNGGYVKGSFVGSFITDFINLFEEQDFRIYVDSNNKWKKVK